MYTHQTSKQYEKMAGGYSSELLTARKNDEISEEASGFKIFFDYFEKYQMCI